MIELGEHELDRMVLAGIISEEVKADILQDQINQAAIAKYRRQEGHGIHGEIWWLEGEDGDKRPICRKCFTKWLIGYHRTMVMEKING